MARILALISVLLGGAWVAVAAPLPPVAVAASQPALQPATQPADPLSPATSQKIKALIEQLSDDSFARREAASNQLVEIGKPARPALNAAAKDPDPERAQRTQQILQQIFDREWPWGPTVQGMQARASAERTLWQPGEIPRLHFDLRNTGTQAWEVVKGQANLQLEVDGQWHIWDVVFTGGELVTLGPGQSLNDQLVTLSPLWKQAKDADLLGQLEWGGVILAGDNPARLQLWSGKHTVRLAVLTDHLRGGFRVVSNAFEIEVAAGRPAPATARMPSPQLAQAFAEARLAYAIAMQTSSQQQGAAAFTHNLATALAKIQVLADLAHGTDAESPAQAVRLKLEDAQKAFSAPAAASQPVSSADEIVRSAHTEMQRIQDLLTGAAPPAPGSEPPEVDLKTDPLRR